MQLAQPPTNPPHASSQGLLAGNAMKVLKRKRHHAPGVFSVALFSPILVRVRGQCLSLAVVLVTRHA